MTKQQLYCPENWSYLTESAYFDAEYDLFDRVMARVKDRLDEIFKCQKGRWDYDTPKEMAEFLLHDAVLGMGCSKFDHMDHLDCLDEKLKADAGFDVCSCLTEEDVGQIAEGLIEVGLLINDPYN